MKLRKALITIAIFTAQVVSADPISWDENGEKADPATLMVILSNQVNQNEEAYKNPENVSLVPTMKELEKHMSNAMVNIFESSPITPSKETLLKILSLTKSMQFGLLTTSAEQTLQGFDSYAHTAAYWMNEQNKTLSCLLNSQVKAMERIDNEIHLRAHAEDEKRVIGEENIVGWQNSGALIPGIAGEVSGVPGGTPEEMRAFLIGLKDEVEISVSEANSKLTELEESIAQALADEDLKKTAFIDNFRDALRILRNLYHVRVKQFNATIDSKIDQLVNLAKDNEAMKAICKENKDEADKVSNQMRMQIERTNLLLPLVQYPSK